MDKGKGYGKEKSNCGAGDKNGRAISGRYQLIVFKKVDREKSREAAAQKAEAEYLKYQKSQRGELSQ